MPCIFCIAVLMLVAGALTSEHLDHLEGQLRSRAVDGTVRRVVDTGSVAKFELTVAVGRTQVPVAVTVFKDYKRVRIQVLTHDLTAEEVERLEDELAEALGAEIVDRADPEHEHDHDHDHDHDHEHEPAARAEDARSSPPEAGPARERQQERVAPSALPPPVPPAR